MGVTQFLPQEATVPFLVKLNFTSVLSSCQMSAAVRTWFAGAFIVNWTLGFFFAPTTVDCKSLTLWLKMSVWHNEFKQNKFVLFFWYIYILVSVSFEEYSIIFRKHCVALAAPCHLLRQLHIALRHYFTHQQQHNVTTSQNSHSSFALTLNSGCLTWFCHISEQPVVFPAQYTSTPIHSMDCNASDTASVYEPNSRK